MTALQTFAIGWALYWWLLFDDSDARHVFAVLAWWSCANWAVFGLMMVGESAEMSPRVHRGLPQSFLGRMLLTWLNPGPGTGYMLMCVVSLTLLATTVLTYVVSNALHMRQALQQEELLAAAFVAAYLMLYVGLIRLAMLVFNRFTQGGIYLSGLLGVLLVLTAVIAPVVVVGLIQYLTDAYRGDFTILHVSNPFWVLYAVESNDLNEISIPLYQLGGGWTAGGFSIPLELIVLAFAAGLMFLVNLLLAAREVERQRAATPTRIIEDEAALKPVKVAEPQRSSPWDDDE